MGYCPQRCATLIGLFCCIVVVKVASAEKDLSAAREDYREKGFSAQVENPTLPLVDVTFVNEPSRDLRVNDDALTGGNNEIAESSNGAGQDDVDPDTRLPREEEAKKNCSTCGGRDLREETVKEMRLGMFTEVLRQKLRMPEFPEEDEPSTETAPSLPSDLLQKIFQNEVSDEETEEFYAVDDEILITGESVSAMCNDRSMTGCYKFDLKDKFTNAIETASLWFNRSLDRTGTLRSQHMKVYEMEVVSGVTHKKLIPLGRNDLINKNGWVSLNLTKFVKGWVEEGAHSKVLAIKCNYGAPGLSEGAAEHQFDYSSVLEIKYAKTETEKRKKKDSNADDCDPRLECCKRPLMVNFDAIGMHNIFRPSSLNVNFCYGSCTGLTHFIYNHTQTKEVYRRRMYDHTFLRDELKPCCVPLVLKDTTMFVLEHDDLVRKIMRNIIVESCGCI